MNNRARELALWMTSQPSITDTDGETSFGPKLFSYIEQWQYFRENPSRLRLVRTLDDDRERYILVACVGPASEALGTKPERAIVLTGHYDVVSVDNFGQMQADAFDAERLLGLLVAELGEKQKRASAEGNFLGETESRALRDFESGNFLPGRGLLDMKAGLAAGLAVLEKYSLRFLSQAAQNAPDVSNGSLVFVAVPDEEGRSHGMRSAVRLLPELCASWGVKPCLAINLDAAVDQGDGSVGRAVFLGSVGKTHPFALFVGSQSHAGAPFDGINPVALAAEFARMVECEPDLFALAGLPPLPKTGRSDEVPPPPTFLYFRELRQRYDVTMPGAVFCSFNMLSFGRGPLDTLAAVKSLATKALGEAIQRLKSRALAYAKNSGADWAPPDREPRVYLWHEIKALAIANNQNGFMELQRDSAESADSFHALATFIEAVAILAGVEGPAAVLGLAPPYYPRAALDKPGREAEAQKLLALLNREVAAAGKKHGQPICFRPFFPGISDMSFMDPFESDGDTQAAACECPVVLRASDEAFSCPAINIGPWGREYHQKYERCHTPYAFTVLPELIANVCDAVLGRERDNSG